MQEKLQNVKKQAERLQREFADHKEAIKHETHRLNEFAKQGNLFWIRATADEILRITTRADIAKGKLEEVELALAFMKAADA